MLSVREILTGELSDSARPVYERQCAGKRPYRSKQDVKRANKKFAAHGGAVLRPYHCQWCGSFHLGGRRMS